MYVWSSTIQDLKGFLLPPYLWKKENKKVRWQGGPLKVSSGCFFPNSQFDFYFVWIWRKRERERKWQGSCKGWRWSLGTSTATFSLSGFLDMLKIELLCGGKRKTERKKGAAILKSQKHEMSYTISFSLLLCLLNACSRQSDPWLE